MYAAAVDSGLALVATYGIAILLVAFVLEGALVGKLIPTRTLLVATALAVGESAFELAAIVAVAVVGATVGQLALFVLVRRPAFSMVSLPDRAQPADDSRTLGWLDRWGLIAVALSNTLPVARGSLTVPAALADGSTVRFSAASVLGTSVYAIGLIGVAAGIETGTAGL